MSATTTRSTWYSLPTELKLAVVDSLDQGDIKAMSRVDQRTYQACVPALFKNVCLDNIDAMEAFLDTVPRGYLAYIENLDVCTAPANPHATPMLARVRSDFIIALLSATPRLVALKLRISGTLDKSIIAPFPFLQNLRTLSMANVGDEARAPLSERLVVSIAFSIPHLTSLSLSRVTRSAMHAPDLAGIATYVPLATSDADIPPPLHPTAPPALSLGSCSTMAPVLPDSTPLSLPTLLLMPTLKRLALKDTHLGDARWGTVTPRCHLAMLDLGSCVHEEEAFNSFCTARIVSAVGDSLSEVGIGSALGGAEDDAVPAAPAPADTDSAPAQSLAALRKLHISPYFPLERVVDTMSALAASPVESVRIECFAEDVVDVCARVEEFLTLREGRGRELRAQREGREAKPGLEESETTNGAEQGGWFARLRTIWVGVADDESASPDGVPSSKDDEDEKEERRVAARRLEAFCAGLRLGGVVEDETPRLKIRSKTVEETGVVATVGDLRKGKGRSMTV